MLGLFVVGSLARRWDIEVTLTRTPGGGVTGTVWIPSALLLTVSPREPRDGHRRHGRPDRRPDRRRAAAPAPTPDAAPTTPGRRPPDAAAAAGRPPPRRQRRAGGPVDAAAACPGASRTAASDRPRPTRRRDDERPAARTDRPPAPAAAASRPLRRRVRGATLPDHPGGRPGRRRPCARPVDADAVRSELDEFEAAVRRAEQDSAAAHGPNPHHRQAPETPRKESGSDHVDR